MHMRKCFAIFVVHLPFAYVIFTRLYLLCTKKKTYSMIIKKTELNENVNEKLLTRAHFLVMAITKMNFMKKKCEKIAIL